MKIYYVCEYCERIFQEIEVQGDMRGVQVSGICDDCAMEMGLTDPGILSQHYYS